jgi:glyoxylase-like metal-dependent hydrolase (beta-lactamase superfamily II)
VTPVDDGGGRLRAGGFGLMVIHSPGHIAGHACDEFATEDGRQAFIDDTVLPVYTPNVGGSDCRLDNPYPSTSRRSVTWQTGSTTGCGRDTAR